MKNVFTYGILLGLCLLATITGAQDKGWYEGKITLASNQTLAGLISFNWDGDVVQVRLTDGRIRAFSPAQVQTFTWATSTKSARVFGAFPVPAKALGHQSRHPDRLVFLETHLTGHYPVFRRMQKKHGFLYIRPKRPGNVANQQDFAGDRDHFDYFVYDGKAFRNLFYFYRDIEPLMADYQPTLDEFARAHQLNLREPMAQLMLIDRYNQLKAAELKGKTDFIDTLSAQ
ncbi:hypothetical protein [Arsenicibacter rosenii]|uniref:Uncharacterized protein n=1 Tax=Arsenicibacter rosenii TaxID=1750698 RepID=A0A1S2VFZ7_9BACT|nr:hypothetical protein [Arsenicibacter rosenii]OIN57205.1 hypothetical protein BLX24_20825 [Arsenicibacter rosenii]